MKLRTVLSLLRSGELGLLLSATGAMRRHHRLVFLAAGTSSGLFARLAKGPVPLDRLADGLLADPSMRDGLEAWLRVGVGLGELRAGPSGYGLRGALARKLADPRHDAAAALVEETARLHSVWILESPARLRAGRRFMLGDQDGRLVARSSRLVEPFVCEAIDDVVPRAGPVRLLEIGCGSAVYIRHAAGRNPELTALGLELQPEVAALAAENVSAWGLARRVAIEAGDVMARAAEAAFDLATLHNNIYYFPVEDRMRVLRHVRAFLGPGGRLLLTTLCQGKGVGVDILDLWASMTEGCGRLPRRAELIGQLGEAGFEAIEARILIPGESFHAFVGTRGA